MDRKNHATLFLTITDHDYKSVSWSTFRHTLKSLAIVMVCGLSVVCDVSILLQNKTNLLVVVFILLETGMNTLPLLNGLTGHNWITLHVAKVYFIGLFVKI